MSLNFLNKLGLTDIEQRILMLLFEYRSLSAKQVSERLQKPRTTIYNQLDNLIKIGVIYQKDIDSKRIYSPVSKEDISHIFKLRIESLRDAEKEINDFLDNNEISQNLDPKVNYFRGRNGAQRALYNLLAYENIPTYTMWPIYEMADVLGRDFLEDLNRKRIRRRVSIQGIWPHNADVDFSRFPFLGIGKQHLREIRLSPKTFSTKMSYWIFSDKVVFTASKKELFGFTVQSKEFAELQKAQFHTLFELSKALHCKHRTYA